MFGYIKPMVKELKVKEHDLYKSTYCGLCRVMGKRYSYVYKMSISYDFVFMVLIRLFACPEPVSFSQKRCIAHPTKKKTMMNSNAALEISSDVGVIMLYHDLMDKINDKDGAKSVLYRLLLPELKRLRKKACKNALIQKFDSFASEKLRKLSEIEKENTPSADIPSEEFGILLGEAISLGLEGNIKRTVFEIGKNIGKWIYIVDAADDIDKDNKKHTYNPFIASFGGIDEAKSRGETIKVSLLNILSNADKALALLDNTDDGISNILTNIIRLGSVDTHDNILTKNNFKEFT